MRKLGYDYSAFADDPAAFYGEARVQETPKTEVTVANGTEIYKVPGAELTLNQITDSVTVTIYSAGEPRLFLLVADWLLQLRDRYSVAFLYGYAAEAADVAIRYRGLRGTLPEAAGTYPMMYLDQD